MHGFDPRGPAVYRKMYAEEAAKEAARDGIRIEVGERRRTGKRAETWQVEADFGDGAVSTSYTFLRWDDIVAKNWLNTKGAMLLMIGRYLTAFSRSRFLTVGWKQATPAFLAIFFPPAVIAAYVLVALLLVALLTWLAVLIGLPGWVVLPLAGAVGGGAWFLWDRLETALNPCWLARVMGFLTDWAGGRVKGLEERNRLFAEAFAAALDDPANDEVLVVGHSIGAHHAVEALIALEVVRPRALADPRLRFLTLGQCLPLLARLRGADTFNAALGALICDHQVLWVDVTSPSDPASSCAIDPLSPTPRNRPEEAPVYPFHVSPRFHTLMAVETYKRVRRDPLLFHFQYLRSQEQAGPYDYFRLTAGSDPLEPFGDRIEWTVKAGDYR